MTRDEAIAYCLTHTEAQADCPFEEEDAVVARHRGSRKWFAIFLNVRGQRVVNLKCDPQKADFWRAAYPAVTPGYHMNKQHWNTVWLDGDLPDADLREMIDDSFALTDRHRPPQKRT